MVNRFRAVDSSTRFTDDPYGNLVLYDDYATLEEENSVLRGIVKALPLVLKVLSKVEE